MSKKNILLNNDGLYNEYRNNYEDSIDFFTEKKIEVKDKLEPFKEEEEKEDIEGVENTDLEYIQGLENLVTGFSKYNADPKLIEIYKDLDKEKLDDLQGSELYVQIDTDPILTQLVRASNDCFRMVKGNTKKLHKKVKDIDKKRRKGSIRTKPIKMKSIVKKLGTSKNVTSDPLWIPTAVGDSIKFAGNMIDSIYGLAKFADERPRGKEARTELELRIFSTLGKGIVGGSSNKSIYSTNPLPGNTIFNLKLSTNFFFGGISASYTDVKTPVNVPSETCLPTANLVDKCLDALESYLYLFTRYGDNLIKLLRIVYSERIKADKLKWRDRNAALSSLVNILNIAKRLLKALFKHVNHVTDALYTFINQGIK